MIHVRAAPTGLGVKPACISDMNIAVDFDQWPYRFHTKCPIARAMSKFLILNVPILFEILGQPFFRRGINPCCIFVSDWYTKEMLLGY